LYERNESRSPIANFKRNYNTCIFIATTSPAVWVLIHTVVSDFQSVCTLIYTLSTPLMPDVGKYLFIFIYLFI